VVQAEFSMAANKQASAKTRNAGQPRASVTFPPELYKTLEDLAKQKKVSLAWIVREAAEKYVADQWPLFGATLLGEKR
jgi:CopG-like RHH_1 or ribbon-helix-helix domain, RHH_5